MWVRSIRDSQFCEKHATLCWQITIKCRSSSYDIILTHCIGTSIHPFTWMLFSIHTDGQLHLSKLFSVIIMLLYICFFFWYFMLLLKFNSVGGDYNVLTILRFIVQLDQRQMLKKYNQIFTSLSLGPKNGKCYLIWTNAK